MNLILASASPRRHELLLAAGFPHKVMPTDSDESLEPGTPPDEAVKTLSRRKAEAAAKTPEADGSIIIAADTVVYADGKILGKPVSEDDAKYMLRLYSGKKHSVFTGITVTDGKQYFTDAVETVVTFRELDDGEIDTYVSSGQPFDKAGAYGIQGGASIFVSHIDGDYFNIVGLPLCRLSEILKNFTK